MARCRRWGWCDVGERGEGEVVYSGGTGSGLDVQELAWGFLMRVGDEDDDDG